MEPAWFDKRRQRRGDASTDPDTVASPLPTPQQLPAPARHANSSDLLVWNEELQMLLTHEEHRLYEESQPWFRGGCCEPVCQAIADFSGWTLRQVLYLLIPLLICIGIPVGICYLAIKAEYSPQAIVMSTSIATFGVLCFLITPLGPAEKEAMDTAAARIAAADAARGDTAFDKLRKTGDSMKGSLERQKSNLKSSRKQLVRGAADGCCGSCVVQCCDRLGDLLATSVQLMMGASAITAAYSLLSSFDLHKWADDVVIGVCVTVQALDSLAFILVSILGWMWVDQLRMDVNARKDAIEDWCVEAAQGLIQCTRALAVVTAKHARRVYVNASSKMKKGAGGDDDSDDPEETAELSSGEVATLKLVDSTGSLMRSSPLKCLVTTLNLMVFVNGLRDFDDAMRVLRSQLGVPKVQMPKWAREVFQGPSTTGKTEHARTESGWHNASHCVALAPCEVLVEEPDRKTCDHGKAYFPQSDDDAVTIQFRPAIKTREVAIHYQIPSDALDSGDHAFSFILTVAREIYRVDVVTPFNGGVRGITMRGITGGAVNLTLAEQRVPLTLYTSRTVNLLPFYVRHPVAWGKYLWNRFNEDRHAGTRGGGGGGGGGEAEGAEEQGRSISSHRRRGRHLHAWDEYDWLCPPPVSMLVDKYAPKVDEIQIALLTGEHEAVGLDSVLLGKLSDHMATAAASTDAVRKRTRPREYDLSKQREAERQAAMMAAAAADRARRGKATRALGAAMAESKRMKSMSRLKSMKPGEQPVGINAAILIETRMKLQMTIADAIECNLPDEVVAEAQQALDDVSKFDDPAMAA